ncbi:MAG: hypothetical protein RI894_1259 [Bacteroidota bacterium]
MKNLFQFISLLALFLPALAAQTSLSQAASTQSNFGETKSLSLDSETYKTKRTVLLKLPADYERTKIDYPLVYIMDAGDRLKFDFYCQTIDNLVENEEMPPCIIIGVVAAEGRRNYEFTPVSTSPKQKDYGGATQFLRYLQRDLLPYIDGNYRTSNYRLLIGHSFGALFAAYALVYNPDLFNSVVAISPTLWYNEGLYISKLDSLAKKCPSPHSFFFAVGDEGETENSLRPSAIQLYENLKARDCKQFHWQLLEMHDKNHRTTPLFAVPEALAATFKPWKIPLSLQKSIETNTGDPLTLLEKHADFRKKYYNFSFDWSENDYVYLMALPYLENKNALKAKATLQEALSHYPNSSLILECQGDLAVLQGENEQAKAYYETALQKLLPKESHFAAAINQKLAKLSEAAAKRK